MEIRTGKYKSAVYNGRSVMGVVFTGFIQITSKKERQFTLLDLATFPSSHYAACISHQVFMKPCQFVSSKDRFTLKINYVDLLKRGLG
jgi:hypothetical protein